MAPPFVNNTIQALGGRKKITKVLAILSVLHCIYTVTRDPTKSTRRASSNSTTTPFQANDKTLPLELLQAIQQAGLAGDSSTTTPATELTNDSARFMTGAALHGGPTSAESLSNTFTGKSAVGLIPDENDPGKVAYLKSLTPGDPNDEAAEDSDRGLFKLFGDKKGKQDDGSAESVSSETGVDPEDEKYLLHNLDPAAVQKMDAHTLQKVMEVNNINPKVLPSLSASSALIDSAAVAEKKVPVPAHKRVSEAQLSKQMGFLGGSKNKKNDDPGKTLLDGPPKLPHEAQVLTDVSGPPDVPGPPPQCKRPPRIPAPKLKEVKPTINASYPGSGARLSWKLIRAITGLMTSDDAVDTDDISKKHMAVSIKTHYPAHGSSESLFKPYFKVDRAVLLIRNPMKSMPSFLSYLYERENDLENHSTRVPVEDWILWRDENFHKELQSWVHHTLFWMEHNAPEDTLIMSYERLVDPNTGPDELLRLGQFLQETSGEKLAQKEKDIPCVWDFVVNNRGDTSVNGKTPQSLRTGPKHYPYDDDQIDTMIHYLSSLGKLYPDQLGPMMDGYIVDTMAMKAKVTNQVQE